MSADTFGSHRRGMAGATSVPMAGTWGLHGEQDARVTREPSAKINVYYVSFNNPIAATHPRFHSWGAFSQILDHLFTLTRRPVYTPV